MNVALFVTCVADHYFAEAAADAVRLLRHLGCDVTFPAAQTCCGQPAYSAGATSEAERMARHTTGVFADCEAVVVPGGSCATMVKRFYPRLARGLRAGGGGGGGEGARGRTAGRTVSRPQPRWPSAHSSWASSSCTVWASRGWGAGWPGDGSRFTRGATR